MEYQAQMQAATPQYAGVWPRFLALLIDAIIIGIVSGIVGGILGAVGGSQQSGLVGGLIGLLAIVYIFAMEATRGATIGKMVMGLRVVRLDGTPIGWSESIIRNLLRIVDSLFGYLVGAIIIWNSPLKQRLGDKVAHTVVIKSK